MMMNHHLMMLLLHYPLLRSPVLLLALIGVIHLKRQRHACVHMRQDVAVRERGARVVVGPPSYRDVAVAVGG